MIYLDNAATSFPKPPCVKEAVVDFIDNIGASVGRSAYKSAIKSSRILHNTRTSLADFINLPSANRIFFTYNATYAINFALSGILQDNDKVLVTQIEHNAIMRPLKYLESTRNIKILEIPTDKYCKIDLKEAKRLAKDVKLIACVAGNNVTGAILPLDSIKQIAKEENATLLIDATQILGICPFSSDGIDIVCGSGHKGLLSPMGIGFCAINENMELFDSLVFGGTGSKSDNIIQPDILPDKYESGTQNMHSIAGLNASLEWIKNFGINKIFKEENILRSRLKNGLSKIDGITICDTEDSYDKTGVISFFCPNISKMAYLLDEQFDICIRAGLHCSIATHKTIGTFNKTNSGTIRLSPSIYTTNDEIETTLHAIGVIMKEILKK